MTKSTLNPSEAVYGFAAWLTTRSEKTVMSAADDAAPIAELVKQFCEENSLPEISDQWPHNLIHPSGEVAVPGIGHNALESDKAIDLKAVFDKYDDGDEYLKFERVQNKLHSRPDICAFLLLDKLVPSTGDMVAGAGHDEIYLDTDCEELAAVATEEDVLTLIRCGVRFTGEGLEMFV